MSDGILGWMAAAKCCESPRPATTFADLPRRDKGEIVRVALVSAAAAAYFVAMGILTKPIPSRSLLSGVDLPNAPAPRSALFDARETPAIDPVSPPPSVQTAQVGYEQASVRTPARAMRSTAGQPSRKERRGFFSRLFRGIARGVQPGTSKADSP